MSEEWRPVVGYEGIYEVSSLGSVRRIAPAKGATVGHNLVLCLHPNGYHRVYLCWNNKRRSRLASRLVAAAFLGPSDLEVNHKNGNTGDNRIGNLEYMTRQENAEHARINGFYARGEKVAAANLNRHQVREIRKLKGKMTYEAIAARFGVTYSGVQAILCGRTWAWLS